MNTKPMPKPCTSPQITIVRPDVSAVKPVIWYSVQAVSISPIRIR